MDSQEEQKQQESLADAKDREVSVPQAALEEEAAEPSREPAVEGGIKGEAPPDEAGQQPAEGALETPVDHEVEAAPESVDATQLGLVDAAPAQTSDEELQAILEAVIYVTDEPLSPSQIAAALGQSLERVQPLLDRLVDEYNKPERGLTIREVAGGYKMATKPEHHETIRTFVKNLKPPLKLSLAALETLAVIAYKQPITAPEIMDIRGVQGAGVLKTLLDRKLIGTAGRKNVIGKPMLYKTTREFLLHFGLKDLSELPTLKEFEELRRLAISDEVGLAPESVPAPAPEPATPAPQEPESDAS